MGSKNNSNEIDGGEFTDNYTTEDRIALQDENNEVESVEAGQVNSRNGKTKIRVKKIMASIVGKILDAVC